MSALNVHTQPHANETQNILDGNSLYQEDWALTQTLLMLSCESES